MSNTTFQLIKFVCKFLWLFILLPKEGQFVLFLVLSFALIRDKKNPIKFDIPILFLLLALLVYVCAILIQIMFESPDQERTFAAINTSLCWLFAIVFFGKARELMWNDERINLISRYLLINFSVLSILYILSIITNITTINILGFQYTLRGVDYMDIDALDDSYGAGSRFRGFMGSALSAAHLVLLSLPIIILGMRRTKKRFWVTICIVCFAYLAVIGTHSRSGIIAVSFALLLLLFVILLNQDQFVEIKKTVAIFIGIIILAIFVIYADVIYNFLVSLLNSRQGSNNARFAVYSASLQETLKKSPIIGMGIKYMFNGIPLGSHNTYIGIFYKTGILGSMFFLFGITGILNQIWRGIKEKGLGISLFLVVLSYFGFCIFADIDGNDWTVVFAFITWGILASLKNNKPYERRQSNYDFGTKTQKKE